MAQAALALQPRGLSAAELHRAGPEVPARARTTTRLRKRLVTAVEDGRAQAEVAATFGVSWPTVQRAVVAHGQVELGEPAPTPVLGLDETRFGRPRWMRGPGGGWVRSDPWESGFVDLGGGQGLLGQVDGRTSATSIAGKREPRCLVRWRRCVYGSANLLPLAVAVYSELNILTNKMGEGKSRGD